MWNSLRASPDDHRQLKKAYTSFHSAARSQLRLRWRGCCSGGHWTRSLVEVELARNLVLRLSADEAGTGGRITQGAWEGRGPTRPREGGAATQPPE